MSQQPFPGDGEQVNFLDMDAASFAVADLPLDTERMERCASNRKTYHPGKSPIRQQQQQQQAASPAGDDSLAYDKGQFRTHDNNAATSFPRGGDSILYQQDEQEEGMTPHPSAFQRQAGQQQRQQRFDGPAGSQRGGGAGPFDTPGASIVQPLNRNRVEVSQGGFSNVQLSPVDLEKIRGFDGESAIPGSQQVAATSSGRSGGGSQPGFNSRGDSVDIQRHDTSSSGNPQSQERRGVAFTIEGGDRATSQQGFNGFDQPSSQRRQRSGSQQGFNTAATTTRGGSQQNFAADTPRGNLDLSQGGGRISPAAAAGFSSSSSQRQRPFQPHDNVEEIHVEHNHPTRSAAANNSSTQQEQKQAADYQGFQQPASSGVTGGRGGMNSGSGHRPRGAWNNDEEDAQPSSSSAIRGAGRATPSGNRPSAIEMEAAEECLNLQFQLDEARNKIQSMHLNLEDLERRVHEQDDEIERLNTEAAAAAGKVKKAEVEKNRLKTQLDKASKTHQEEAKLKEADLEHEFKQRLEQTHKSHKKELDDLETLLESTRADLEQETEKGKTTAVSFQEELDREVRNLNDQIADYKKRLNTELLEGKQLMSDKQELEEEINQLKNQGDQVVLKYQQLQNDNDDLRQQCATLNEAAAQERDLKQQLFSEYKDFKESHAEHVAKLQFDHRQAMDEVRRMIQDKEKRLAHAEQELELLTADSQREMEERLRKIKEDSDATLKHEMSMAVAQYKELQADHEAAVGKLKSLEFKERQGRESITRREDFIKNLQDNIAQEKRRAEGFAMEIDQMKNDWHRERSEVESSHRHAMQAKNDDLNILREEMKKLQIAAQTDAEAATERCDRANRLCESATREVKELKEELALAKKQHKSTDDEKKGFRTELENVELKLSNLTRQKDDLSTEVQARVFENEKLQESLDKYKKLYSDSVNQFEGQIAELRAQLSSANQRAAARATPVQTKIPLRNSTNSLLQSPLSPLCMSGTGAAVVGGGASPRFPAKKMEAASPRPEDTRPSNRQRKEVNLHVCFSLIDQKTIKEITAGLKELYPNTAFWTEAGDSCVPHTITHIITGGGKTTKLCSAYLSGCWVVTADFVKKCIESRRWMSEVDHPNHCVKFDATKNPFLKSKIFYTSLFKKKTAAWKFLVALAEHFQCKLDLLQPQQFDTQSLADTKANFILVYRTEKGSLFSNSAEDDGEVAVNELAENSPFPPQLTLQDYNKLYMPPDIEALQQQQQ